MSKDDNNKQIDADILQSKADILRARDIMPPHKEKMRQKPESQKTGENTTQPAKAAEISTQKEKTTPEKTGSIAIEPIPAKKTAPVPKPAVSVNKKGKAETLQEKTEIPRFDLAEEIMAEQRKVTAIKRKAPGKKNEAEGLKLQAEAVGYTTIEPTAPTLSEQDQIIAEIVARDIERLRRDDTSDGRG